MFQILDVWTDSRLNFWHNFACNENQSWNSFFKFNETPTRQDLQKMADFLCRKDSQKDKLDFFGQLMRSIDYQKMMRMVRDKNVFLKGIYVF